MNTEEKDTQIYVRFPAALAERLRERAERDDRSIAATVRVAVEEFLSKQMGKRP